MEYSKLVAVTGMPGLFELVSSKGDGAIVRSLDDNSTKFASSRIHNFSHLESIEVYTTGHNVNLVDVFQAMENGKESLPDDKNNKAIRQYFEATFPEMDFDRVYPSDMKKMVKWFDILKKNNIEIKLSEEEIEEEEETEEEEKAAKQAAAEKKEEKKLKAADKKTKEKAEDPEADEVKKHKTAAQKKPVEKESKEKAPAKKAAPKKAAKKKSD